MNASPSVRGLIPRRRKRRSRERRGDGETMHREEREGTAQPEQKKERKEGEQDTAKSRNRYKGMDKKWEKKENVIHSFIRDYV